MASSSLLPRVFLGAAIVLTAVSGVKNYSNRSIIKTAVQERETARQAEQALTAKAKKASDEAAAAKRELKIVMDAKKAADSSISGASGQIEDVKKQLASATAKAAELDAKNKELQAKIASVSTAAAPVTVQDPELVKKVAEAEAKAAEHEQVLKALQTKNEEAEKKTAALEADNARRLAGLNKPGLEGKVLAVNPGWSFVVLNIGDRQGVVAGSSLIVKRGGSLVAKLRVTSVEPSTSIADIQVGSISKGATVQPGDVVIFPGS